MVLTPQIIGPGLLTRDDEAAGPRTRIATAFPRAAIVVTLPGIHATQRVAYVDAMNRDREHRGMPPLTEQQEEEQWASAVDLIIEDGTILIRPDPENMELAFEADELLQQLVSKRNIRFLHVRDRKVREAITQRGECWRINPLPRSPDEMVRMIQASRIAIAGRDIYYFNKSSGTRLLTFHQFRGLGALDDEELRRHLLEIGEYCSRTNRQGNREISLFAASDAALFQAFAQQEPAVLTGDRLRQTFETLCRALSDAVPAEFREDDPASHQWRSRMYAALIGQTDKEVSEEQLLGLSAEFFMQVEWVPGARIEEGELILDSVFEEEQDPCARPADKVCDETARAFIFNFIRDYANLEYVNLGRVVGSLSSRLMKEGRRGVYVAEIKQRGDERPILRIIRMQKWGVGEHLDEGKDLLSAILESEDYTEYILDRRLGCRQLGMNLSPRTTARKIVEPYLGTNGRYRGQLIWSAYFERDYIPGVATDKIPTCRLADEKFAIPFARLLGRAAAPNLILGRCQLKGDVVFDDGDELVVENRDGVPTEILVADHTGTFVDYQRDLAASTPAYASCILKHARHSNDPKGFSAAFLDAFVSRFQKVQQEYRRQRRAFNTLFKHKHRDEAGSFAFRWERVLRRLDASDPRELAELIRRHL